MFGDFHFVVSVMSGVIVEMKNRFDQVLKSHKKSIIITKEKKFVNIDEYFLKNFKLEPS